MESFFTKIAELKFDRLTTLRLIEKIEDLNAIFTEDVKLPFSVLYRLTKEGKLPERTEEMITSIFEELISTKEEYAIRYNQLLNTGEDIQPEPIVETVVEPVIEAVVEPIVEVKPKAVKVVKVVKEKSVPRRYGKENVERDITIQGGVATPLQRAMLSTNNLKNLYVNMSNKLIREYFGDAVLTDEDYRKIQSVVTTVERQFKEILKKK
jgi:hypothetical protein